MKKVLIIASALVFSTGAALSQGLADAYRYAQTGDLNGTARSMSMGGAFGALGGDISVMNINPAGLAVYRSSEVVATLDLSTISAKTDWQGSTESNKKTKFNFNNFAYVGYFPTGKDAGLVSWNVGLSYNRLKNYARSYRMSASGELGASMTDYIAARANLGGLTPDMVDVVMDGDRVTYNPYEQVGDWLSVMGANSGFINYRNGQYESALPPSDYQRSYTEMQINESGAIDQYTIAFGANISDIVLLGASVAITDMKYDMYAYYAEDYNKHTNYTSYIEMENGLSTDGTGYNLNIGAIVRPVDFLRIGVAYNSPTWYKMTDSYNAWGSADIQSNPENTSNTTPQNAFTDYKFRTPDKWIFSAAAIFGQTALLSVDYEVMNYRRMRMYDYNGNENPDANTPINQFLGISNTLRIGAEVKVTPQFAVRAGASWTGSGMNDDLKEGNVEVVTVGTLPHYTIDRGITNYTVGLGYRFTPQFYIDLACVLKTLKEDAYAFSPIYSDEGSALITSLPASLKTKSTRVALTLGYKF